MCGAGTVAPASARLFAGLRADDMFHLIRAGVTGGKGVPDTVADNPLVFATLTGPAFGAVHGRRDHGHRCHPLLGKAPIRRCVHDEPRFCDRRHGEDDPLLGQPLCPDCYDYPSHVVWQWWAPDLWRRFPIPLRRLIAHVLGVPRPGWARWPPCSTPRSPSTSCAAWCTPTPWSASTAPAPPTGSHPPPPAWTRP